jgi:tetratricopeptide (TPR) repeat protein
MNLEVRNRLIDQLVARGQLKDATNELINLAEVHYSLAELTESRKTYTRALRMVQQSEDGDTWRVRILHRIADIDVQSLNWRQALTIYQQICSIQPDDIEANRKLIDLNFRLGERNQAQAALDHFIKTFRKAGRRADIIVFLEKLSENWPERVILKQYLAEFYQEIGQIEDAIQQLDAVGEIFLESGNQEAAIRMIQKIITLNPRDVDKYKRLLDELQLQ